MEEVFLLCRLTNPAYGQVCVAHTFEHGSAGGDGSRGLQQGSDQVGR